MRVPKRTEVAWIRREVRVSWGGGAVGLDFAGVEPEAATPAADIKFDGLELSCLKR